MNLARFRRDGLSLVVPGMILMTPLSATPSEAAAIVLKGRKKSPSKGPVQSKYHRQSGRDTRDALTRARAARPRQLPDEARAPEYRTSYFQRIIYV